MSGLAPDVRPAAPAACCCHGGAPASVPPESRPLSRPVLLVGFTPYMLTNIYLRDAGSSCKIGPAGMTARRSGPLYATPMPPRRRIVVLFGHGEAPVSGADYASAPAHDRSTPTQRCLRNERSGKNVSTTIFQGISKLGRSSGTMDDGMINAYPPPPHPTISADTVGGGAPEQKVGHASTVESCPGVHLGGTSEREQQR